MKLFETDKFYYKYYPSENEDDTAKILQINKETKEKRWVNEAMDGIWEDLENAKEIDSFDFEVEDDYIK